MTEMSQVVAVLDGALMALYEDVRAQLVTFGNRQTAAAERRRVCPDPLPDGPRADVRQAVTGWSARLPRVRVRSRLTTGAGRGAREAVGGRQERAIEPPGRSSGTGGGARTDSRARAQRATGAVTDW